MSALNFLILLFIVVFSTNMIGQENYRLENPMNVQLQWKPLVGDFKKLQVETKKYKAAKKELIFNNSLEHKQQKLNISSDTHCFM